MLVCWETGMRIVTGIALSTLFRDLFVALLLTAYATAKAATISASSCSATDVQTALNLAKAGDTVLIPAGSSSWTGGISWNAPPNVTVKGAGTSATGGGDKTVITDNIASGTRLLAIAIPATGVFRMSGITFQSGTGATKDNGTLEFRGPGIMRIDHVHLNMTSTANYKAIEFDTTIFGVLDHSILDLTG